MNIQLFPRYIKIGIKDFCEKHPGSIIIPKMVNDALRVWKESHSITMFRCYFCINKGHDHILLVDDKVTEATWKDILCYPKREAYYTTPFRIIFKHFSFYINSRIIQHQINDGVYWKTTHNYIHWLNGVWKDPSCFWADWKRIQ